MNLVVIVMMVAVVVVAAFDANCAGVLGRYYQDFGIALSILTMFVLTAWIGPDMGRPRHGGEREYYAGIARALEVKKEKEAAVFLLSISVFMSCCLTTTVVF